MRNGLLEFVLDGDAAARTDSPLAAAGIDVGWAADGPARSLRRTWLDTFDWRLYRAGLTLEQVSSRGSAELTLTGRDGAVIATQQIAGRSSGGARIRWPSLIGALPPGPLTEHLEPVVGVRALAPVARAVSRIRDQRVLNSDDKTVARLAVDTMSVTYPATATAPPRLTIWPLRGYQAQADRLTHLLAAAPGVAESSQSALEAALAAAGGRRPGDYTGKIEVRLSAAMPGGQALALVLTSLLNTLEANLSGTVRAVDTEFLHDLRVAVRRTRSALKLAGDALPAGLARRYAPEFRWLGALTTPTRDLDVYLLDYPGMAAGLVAATPAELLPFHDHLERSRATAQRDLVRGLRSARFTRLTGPWRAALAEVCGGPGQPGGRGRRLTAAKLAATRITLAHRRVLAAGRAITGTSPPQSLHDLRKRCKELRYLLEIFGSLYDPAEHWQAVRALKDLQNCLGEFQDSEVQRTEIRMFAAQMLADRAAPAPTLLAMGEIAAGLAGRQRRARAEFGDRFLAFASPASQAKIRDLTRAAA